MAAVEPRMAAVEPRMVAAEPRMVPAGVLAGVAVGAWVAAVE